MIVKLNNKRVQVKTSTSRFIKVKMGEIGVRHWLRVSVDDNTMGTALGTGFYLENSQVQVKAIANPGYKFIRWSDSNADATRTIIVDDDIELIAYFEKDDAKGILTYIPNKEYVNPPAEGRVFIYNSLYESL